MAAHLLPFLGFLGVAMLMFVVTAWRTQHRFKRLAAGDPAAATPLIRLYRGVARRWRPFAIAGAAPLAAGLLGFTLTEGFPWAMLAFLGLLIVGYTYLAVAVTDALRKSEVLQETPTGPVVHRPEGVRPIHTFQLTPVVLLWMIGNAFLGIPLLFLVMGVSRETGAMPDWLLPALGTLGLVNAAVLGLIWRKQQRAKLK